MKISHREEFQSWGFEREPFVISSDLELTLETSALKLFTVANAQYQLSWNPQESWGNCKIEIFNYFETFFYLNIGKELPYGKFMLPAPSLESWLAQERENFSRRYMRGVNPLFTFLKESNLV